MAVDRMKEFADLFMTEFVFNRACDPKTVEDPMRVRAADIRPAVRAHAVERSAG